MAKRKKKKENIIVNAWTPPTEYVDVEPKEEIVESIPEPEPSEYERWLSSAPLATEGVPTARWYGETFLPAYKKWLAEGKKFV